MPTECQHLYLFLSACRGNWRNSVYIFTDGPGYLLSADRDGRPVLMAAEAFQQLTGETIDPSECCGRLTADAFNALYAQYLIWHLPSADTDPLLALAQGKLSAPI